MVCCGCVCVCGVAVCVCVWHVRCCCGCPALHHVDGCPAYSSSWGVRMASPAWCRSVPPQWHRMCPTHSHIHSTHTLTTHIIPHTPSLCLHIHHLSLLTLCSTFPHRMSCHVTVPVPAMSCSYTQPVSVSPTLEALRVRHFSGRSRSVTKWSVVLPSATLHAFVPSSMSVCVVMFV